MKDRDVIENWLEKQLYANKEYLCYTSFNSYLREEFGIQYADTLQGCVQRYILLQWYYYQQMGYVCTTIQDLLSPSSLFSDLFKRLKGEEWTNDFVLELLQNLPFKGDFRPFILEEDRLYMHRYWDYERFITDWINRGTEFSTVYFEDAKRLYSQRDYEDWVREHFKELDEAKLSVLLHLFDTRLSIITGGPGTGKTYTLEKILRVCHHWFPNKRVYLAAPTGKAAKRMGQSISIDFKDIYGAPTTIHKMLEVQWDGIFRRTEKRKLSADLVIIDEASMVDIDLFYHMLKALKDDTQLVLLGDHHQLESVEAGSLLGDLCSIGAESTQLSLPYQVFELYRVYRQTESSHIPELAESIKMGNVDLVKHILKDVSKVDVNWIESNLNINSHVSLLHSWAEHDLSYLQDLKLGDSSIEVAQIESYKVLSPHRVGSFGCDTFNRIMDQRNRQLYPQKNLSLWYVGRPIIIQVNDPNTKLYNGDIGVCTAIDPDRITKLDDGEEDILVSRLPHYELAYALTIHKSQGSEFDHVLVILHPEDSLLHTRELLYTAVTRAKKSITILATEEQLKKAVSTRTNRRSGLIKKLTQKLI